VAFAAVLAVALLNARDRRLELRLDAALGQPAAMVALRYGLGALPPAVLGLVIGAGAAWGIVTGVGPPGQTSRDVFGSAVQQAAVATGAALVLVVAVYGLTAALAARPDPAAARRVRVPWEFALLVALGTALAGLYSRPADLLAPVGLNLAVPLLAVASVGAVGGTVVMVAFRLLHGAVGSRIRSRGAAVRSLAIRRAATAAGSVVIVTLLTASLGILGYTLASEAAVDQAIADKVATSAGAAATSPIEASWLLDPQAPELPVTAPDQPPPEPQDLPPRRQPPLPEGSTVVWRETALIPAEVADVDLLILDPRSFETAADWGTGPSLHQAREALRVLGEAEEAAAASRPSESTTGVFPVVLVATRNAAVGNEFTASTTMGPFRARVVAVAATFPGYDSRVPMVIVPADGYLSSLGMLDPRFRDSSPAFAASKVWSSGGAGELASLLSTAGVGTEDIVSAALVEERPEFVVARTGGDYQLAIAFGIAAMALVAVCLHGDRRAAESRATDVLLARVGLGSAGPGRARTLELLALVLLGIVLAVIAVTALAPLGARLLDPAPRLAPALDLQSDLRSYLVMAVAATVMAAGAVTARRPRSRAGSDGAVLRDAD